MHTTTRCTPLTKSLVQSILKWCKCTCRRESKNQMQCERSCDQAQRSQASPLVMMVTHGISRFHFYFLTTYNCLSVVSISDFQSRRLWPRNTWTWTSFHFRSLNTHAKKLAKTFYIVAFVMHVPSTADHPLSLFAESIVDRWRVVRWRRWWFFRVIWHWSSRLPGRHYLIFV